jgi:hypothetical protein
VVSLRRKGILLLADAGRRETILYYGDGDHRVDSDKKEFFVLCRALDPATGTVLWTFTEPHREGIPMGEGQSPAITTIGGRRCALFMGTAV